MPPFFDIFWHFLSPKIISSSWPEPIHEAWIDFSTQILMIFSFSLNRMIASPNSRSTTIHSQKAFVKPDNRVVSEKSLHHRRHHRIQSQNHRTMTWIPRPIRNEFEFWVHQRCHRAPSTTASHQIMKPRRQVHDHLQSATTMNVYRLSIRQLCDQINWHCHILITCSDPIHTGCRSIWWFPSSIMTFSSSTVPTRTTHRQMAVHSRRHHKVLETSVTMATRQESPTFPSPPSWACEWCALP